MFSACLMTDATRKRFHTFEVICCTPGAGRFSLCFKITRLAVRMLTLALTTSIDHCVVPKKIKLTIPLPKIFVVVFLLYDKKSELTEQSK